MIKFKHVKNQRDITLTSALAHEIWRDYYYGIVGMDQTEYMLEKFQSENALKEAIAQGYEYYIIKDNLIPVGYMGIRKDSQKQELFLSKLYLLKDYRKKGISRIAFEEIKKIARQSNLNRIWLTVNKKNISAKIYENLGLIQEKSVNMDIGNGYFMDDYIYYMNV